MRFKLSSPCPNGSDKKEEYVGVKLSHATLDRDAFHDVENGVSLIDTDHHKARYSPGYFGKNRFGLFGSKIVEKGTRRWRVQFIDGSCENVLVGVAPSTIHIGTVFNIERSRHLVEQKSEEEDNNIAYIRNEGDFQYLNNIVKFIEGDIIDIEATARGDTTVVSFWINENNNFPFSQQIIQTGSVKLYIALASEVTVELLPNPYPKEPLVSSNVDTKTLPLVCTKHDFPPIDGSPVVIRMLLGLLHIGCFPVDGSLVVDSDIFLSAARILQSLVKSQYLATDSVHGPSFLQQIKYLLIEMLAGDIVSANKTIQGAVLELFLEVFENLFDPDDVISFTSNLMDRQNSSTLSQVQCRLLEMIIKRLPKTSFAGKLIKCSGQLSNFFNLVLSLWNRLQIDKHRSCSSSSIATLAVHLFKLIQTKVVSPLKHLTISQSNPLNAKGFWHIVKEIFNNSISQLNSFCTPGATLAPSNILSKCAGVLLPLCLASLCNIFDDCNSLPADRDGYMETLLIRAFPAIVTALSNAIMTIASTTSEWPLLSEYVGQQFIEADSDIKLASMDGLSIFLVNTRNLAVVATSKYIRLLLDFRPPSFSEIHVSKLLDLPILQQAYLTHTHTTYDTIVNLKQILEELIPACDQNSLLFSPVHDQHPVIQKLITATQNAVANDTFGIHPDMEHGQTASCEWCAALKIATRCVFIVMVYHNGQGGQVQGLVSKEDHAPSKELVSTWVNANMLVLNLSGNAATKHIKDSLCDSKVRIASFVRRIVAPET